MTDDLTTVKGLMHHLLHVVGIGSEGLEGLTIDARKQVEKATVVAGSAVHLVYVSHLPAQKLQLTGPLSSWLEPVKVMLQEQSVVLLTSGDPLFFGIGRLLRQCIPPEQLVFYPHLSSVQLAFSRVKLPWQDAKVISIHGRSLDALLEALKQSQSLIAVLTDPVHTPEVIAQVLLDLRLPSTYHLWVCAQLGAAQEEVIQISPEEATTRRFTEPNVVILERLEAPLDLDNLPILGLPDSAFCTFADQPGLITKQEVRGLTITLLQPQPQGVIWDVGAGTGSISIEMARLLPQCQIYAVEKNAAGIELIRQNSQRFQVSNVHLVKGIAPEILHTLPQPQRILLGGGGTKIEALLAVAIDRIAAKGRIVANFATLEACLMAQKFLQHQGWSVQLLQVNLARSVSIAESTRFSPLNPVMLLQAKR